MVSTVIFFVFLVIQASCEQKTSLTFLIDTTRSMYTELTQVKETAKSIVDIVINERSCQIEDIVLVTFNDPRVEFRKRTRNAMELKKSLDDIMVHGGGSCPEPSLSGIKLALEESQSGSYVYVFTDASAKDYIMLDEIISMCQEKKSQIVFIITGLCEHEDHPAYQVYHKIAAACNGQVLRITKGQVREVLNYVKESIKGDLTVVRSQLVHSHLSWHYVGFNIDDETKYAMVSAAGKQAFVIALDQLRRPIPGYERITWTDNVKVLKLSHLPPGSYFAKVRGSTEVNVRVISRTDFTFDYGFSDNTTNSLKFAEPQPFTGASTHLIISVNDEENSVAVQTADILDMEERVIKTLPLTHMGGAVFATEEFTPPNHMFKVAVMAKGRRTGNPLRRIAKTPVAPIRLVPVVPEISDSEKYLSAVEGSTLGIHCRITKGKPKPQVTWFFRPQDSKTFTLLQDRTDVVLRMTNVLLKYAGMYKCVADNAAGRAEHDVQLTVKAFLPATKIPSITVNQGQNVLIECMVIKGYPPPMITWQFRHADTETIHNLNTTAKSLRIENVQHKDSGFYKCHATNELGISQQFVQLFVQAVPQIESFPAKIIKANESTTVRIDCKVTNGMPPPIITWLFKAPDAVRYRLLRANVTTLELTNIQILSNSGYYMCMAQNSAGRVTQEVQLVIEALPTIKKNSPIVTAKENENIVIECKITKGIPPPTITWQYKNSDSNSFRNIDNTGEILRITNLQLNNAGFYKCRALNQVGTDEQTVQLIVTVIPQIENFSSKIIKANQGSTVRIDCKVTKGTPSPNITWLFKAPDAVTYQFFKAGVMKLELSDVKVESNSGHYMCVAENSAGRATQEVELVVEDMPVIEINSPIFTEKEGDNVVIQCRITKGTPPPKLMWQYKNSESDTFRDIDNTGEILRITNLQLNNSGFYKCRASNNAGFAQQTVQVIVLVIPQIESFPTEIIKAEQGSTVQLHCKVTKGTPSPNITWLFKAPDAVTYQFLKAGVMKLELSDVKVESNSGHYMCVAENSAGRATQEVELVIEDMPVIEINSPIFTEKEGDNVVIQCRITKGTPPPKIMWQYKNSESDTFRDIDNTGEILRITNLQLNNSGFYKCRATNNAGFAQKTVKVIVLVIPRIESFPTEIIKAEQGSTVQLHCKVTKGSPSPNITWLFKAPDAVTYQFLKAGFMKLELNDVKVESNSGHYMCVAENSAGRATQEVELVVGDTPVIEINSPIFTEKEGNNLVIQCRITKGTPPPKIMWQYKNSESDTFRDIDYTGEILRITNLQLYNSGFYKCRASNIAGFAQQTVQVIVLVIPRIESFPTEIIKAEQGSTVQLHCKVTKGSPSPNITWLFKAPDAVTYQFLKAGFMKLELNDVKVESNSGHYMCVAENSAGRATQEVELVVGDTPVIEINSPIFTEKEGNNLVIQCRITKGTPPPKIMWQYKNSESDTFRDIDYTGEILRITNLQLYNSGFYKCRASNIAGFAQQTVQVIVLVIPRIESFPTEIIKAEQGSTVQLHCKVTKGSPSPNITWLFKAPDAVTYQFLKAGFMKLELNDVKVESNSGHYMCVAENSAGRATQEVELVVGDTPVIEINSPIFTEKEGNNLVIQCRITKGTPPPKIMWQYKNSESDTFRDIDYTGEILRITNLQLYNSGFYKCRASNIAGFAQQTVQVIVLVIPRIESFPTEIIKAEQGSTVQLHCKVTKGSPSPNITWLFKAPDAVTYQFLKAGFMKLELNDVKVESNSGHYMCVAENSAGRATQEVELVVGDTPVIEINSPIFTEKEGNNLVIQCRITKGTPPPKIMWQYKNSESDTFRDIDYTGEILRITNLQLYNSGFYKCRASNIAGFAQQTVQVIVLVIPRIESFPTEIIKAEQGSTVQLHCKVTKGSPSPNITWLFKAPDAVTYQFLKAGFMKLELNDVQVESNSGHYMCVAENSAGRATQEVELVVGDTPVIEINSPIFTEKEGNNLVIQCRITKGIPPPKIMWQYKNSESDTFRDIDNTGEILRITNLQLYNSGFYKCRASNIAGFAQQTVQVIVLVIPRIESFPTEIIKAEQDSTVQLHCKVTKGSPSPNITWLFKAPDAVTYQFLKAGFMKLELSDVKVESNSGHYMCVAENSAGRATQEVELVVGDTPVIEINSPIFTEKEGINLVIQCRITKGIPPPKIMWQYKNSESDTFRDIDNTGEILRITNLQLYNSGFYKCRASNIAGFAQQTVQVIVLVIPRIESFPTEIIKAEQGSTVQLHCKVTKGTPSPHITWLFKAPDAVTYQFFKAGVMKLELSDVKVESNSGHYMCVAENSAGQVTQEVELVVEANVGSTVTVDITGQGLYLNNSEHTNAKKYSYTFKEPGYLLLECTVSGANGLYELILRDDRSVGTRVYFLQNPKTRSTGLVSHEFKLTSESRTISCIAKDVHSGIKFTSTVDLKYQPVTTPAPSGLPPRIVFSPPNSPKYRGVEGDVVMKLPCVAEGHPKPIISWTIDNSSIGTDKSKQSYVEDGSLYVKNPASTDSENTYVCIATNEFGDDNQTYEVLISEFEDYDHPEKNYGKVGKPYEINCSLPFTDPESVRWFYNSVYMNVTGPSLRWENASQVYDGNYTCRVSDLSGAASVTVELTFGSPPFSSAGDTVWEVEWDDQLNIACAAVLIPGGKYEWYFNGEKIEDADEEQLSVYKIGWGNYTCRASNPWGSLDITYYIHTQDCIIDKSLSKTKNMPIILDNTLEWPTFSDNQKFVVVPNSEKLTLVCQDEPPRRKVSPPRAHRNSFTKFRNVRSTVVTCDHEDTFLVDGVAYKISELDCNYPVTPKVVPTRQQCLGENTQMLDVGFYVNDFIKVYSSCVDTDRNLVLYTAVTTKGLDELWTVMEPERSCKQVGNCCYETVELVNAEDVGFGAAERTTLNEQLNSVLYCRPSEDYESTDSFPFQQHLIEIPTSTQKSRREPEETLPRPSANTTGNLSYQQSTTERPNRTPMTSWHDIEKQVRKGPQMTVWSGAGNYTKVDKLMVPQYLWKVVKDLFNEKTVAIVHSNAHAPIPKLCDTECDSSSVLSLFEPHGDRTYCCSLNEFKAAFNLPLAFENPRLTYNSRAY